MERKSPLFHERACMILEEIFEDSQENGEIIPFHPPDEMGAEPMEISSQTHSQPQTQSQPSQNEVLDDIIEDSETSNSCDDPEGSEEPDEPCANDSDNDISPSEYNEDDIVVMAPKVSYRLYRHPTCEGCMNYAPGIAPDQFSHMERGGCLADPEDDDDDIQ